MIRLRKVLRTKRKQQRGFTLVEAVVAMAAGLVVLGIAVMIFKKASDVGKSTMSKDEMQHNGRAALNYMMQDLAQAGTDYQQSGITVPQSSKAVFGCAGCVINSYPNNNMTGIIPYADNSTVNIAGVPKSDAVTVVYVDNTWPPSAQPLALNTAGTGAKISATGDQITVTTAKYTDPTGTQRDYLDSLYGSKVGDVMMVWNANGHVVATVTGVAAGGVLTLASGDVLNLNQTTAGAANVASLAGGAPLYPTTTAASRLKVVSYFVQNTAGPDGNIGTADDIPVLMRQVNGGQAEIVTDSIQSLQITYDLYDTVAATWTFGASGIGGAAPAVTDPTQIRKINVALQLRSQYKNSGGQYDTLWLSSSISPRNLSFSDRYQ